MGVSLLRRDQAGSAFRWIGRPSGCRAPRGHMRTERSHVPGDEKSDPDPLEERQSS
jgi:hypothetical protein